MEQSGWRTFTCQRLFHVSGPDTYFLARPEGLEPPAYWFEANRSIQLSYGRVLPLYAPLSLRLRCDVLQFPDPLPE